MKQESAQTNGARLLDWWRQLAHVYRIATCLSLVVFVAVWLSGAYFTLRGVGSIGQLEGYWQYAASLAVGPLVYVWALLVGLGLLQDSTQVPHTFWWLLALPGPAGGLAFLWLLFQPAWPLETRVKSWQRTRAEARRRAQVAEWEVYKHEVVRKYIHRPYWLEGDPIPPLWAHKVDPVTAARLRGKPIEGRYLQWVAAWLFEETPSDPVIVEQELAPDAARLTPAGSPVEQEAKPAVVDPSAEPDGDAWAQLALRKSGKKAHPL